MSEEKITDEDMVTLPMGDVRKLLDMADDVPMWSRKDHACGECVPGGEIVRQGWLCVRHRTRAALKKAGGEG